jgi:hypothetical protein
MRSRWCCGCPSCNQLLGLTPALLNSDLDKNSSKAGMMEGVHSVMLSLVTKRFDQGKSLTNLDQCFLLDQCQGALLPKQEKTTVTIHVNLGRVNLGLLWELFIPRGKITEQCAVGIPHQLLSFLVGGGFYFFSDQVGRLQFLMREMPG